MRRPVWKRPAFLVPAALLAFLIGYVVYTLVSVGQFKTIVPHFAGACDEVPGVVGAEDIQITADGMAFLAASDRRASMAGIPTHGAIWAYDLTQPSPLPRNLTPSLPFPFNPHGMSLYAASDETLIMVVNHRDADGVFGAKEDFIEVFAYDAGTGALVHRESITDPALRAINDVVAVGPRSFYATRDHHYLAGFMRTVEDFARLPLASVVYFDGTVGRTVAEGFRYANGINVNADGTKIFVAASSDGALNVFSRDASSGDLSNRVEIVLDTGVDNIDVAEDGSLWIGAHPQLLAFVSHAGDASTWSPSQVLRLTLRADGGYEPEEIYLDAGGQLSASSVAATWRDRMLVGPVFDPKFLDCRLP